MHQVVVRPQVVQVTLAAEQPVRVAVPAQQVVAVQIPAAQGVSGPPGAPGPAGDSTWCGLSTGSGNAYTLTPDPAVTAYSAGLQLTWQADRDNTGAVSLGVSGHAAKAVTKWDGRALDAGDIRTDAIYLVAYDAANDQWQALTGVGDPIDGGIY